MAFVDLILDLLYPKHCIGCDERGTFLCPTCTDRIHYFATPRCTSCGKNITVIGSHPQCKATTLDGLIALGEYEGVLQSLIHTIKYDGCFAFAQSAVDLMSTHFPKEYRAVDLIIPVPLHTKRLRERGFNQSELLAKGIARNLHIASASKLLMRTKHTVAQATLKRADRLHNLDHAYAINNDIWRRIKETKKISSVLLIDDVSTTGTTLTACAQILKQAGVKRVYGYVLAHGA